MRVYIRYRHTLKWLCLGRLVVTSLRNYLQMYLMSLSNNSLQDPLHVGAYWLVIISVTAAHVILGVYYFPRSFYVANKEVRSTHVVCKQNDIRREGGNKSESRQVHYPRKLHWNFSNFWWSTKYKILCPTVYVGPSQYKRNDAKFGLW